MLDATTAAPTAARQARHPNPPTKRPRRQLGTRRARVLPASPRPAARVPRPTRPAARARRSNRPAARAASNRPAARASSNSTGSASTASNSNAANSAPNAQAAFNPRPSANAGSNAPAGFKGSGNLKANANTGFDPPTATGGNTAPQSTPSVPPNAKAASGAKPQTCCDGGNDKRCRYHSAGECRPARGPTDWPARTSNQIVFERRQSR